MTPMHLIYYYGIILAISNNAIAFGGALEKEADRSWRDAGYCGVNAAFFMLVFNDVDSNYQFVRESLVRDMQDGTRFDLIANMLRSEGLFVRSVEADYDWLTAQREPVLVHLRNGSEGHFVIVLNANGTKVDIYDPSGSVNGDCFMSPVDFRRLWSGNALAVQNFSELFLTWAAWSLLVAFVLVGILVSVRFCSFRGK